MANDQNVADHSARMAMTAVGKLAVGLASSEVGSSRHIADFGSLRY
jgi:hypothetical protein